MAMEQGSYMLLEPGMAVRGLDGDDLGSVVEVVADEATDIFRGVVVSPPGLLSGGIFVPGEHVTSVIGDIATMDLDREALTHLQSVS